MTVRKNKNKKFHMKKTWGGGKCLNDNLGETNYSRPDAETKLTGKARVWFHTLFSLPSAKHKH